jgi:hypothetical protein
MRALRIGVIDSGVHATHPHIDRAIQGVTIFPDLHEEPVCLDRLGHGTAVAAAILEKAPTVELFAIKVFHDRLATSIHTLVRAIAWATEHDMDLINLSLGTANPDHEAVLQSAVDEVLKKGISLISAYEDSRWLPGRLPGVVPVELDWDCPRDEYRTATLPDSRTLYRASGYPRPIPDVPPERNLKGISFAVANVTGLLARERLGT